MWFVTAAFFTANVLPTCSLPAATDDSHVVPYLNRLSSLLWTAARWVEADDTLLARTVLEDT